MQIALFQNVRQVMAADRLCREAGLSVRVAPVPEKLSNECGMCLRLERAEEWPRLRDICRENGITVTYGEF